MSEIGSFLKALWGRWDPSRLGAVTFTKHEPGPGKGSVHVPSEIAITWDDDPVSSKKELAQEFGGSLNNIYCHPGMRVPWLDSYSRGRKSDVVGLGAFVIDVDLNDAPPGHHKEKPENLLSPEQAYQMFDSVEWLPTFVIKTGGGLHAWYMFDAPVYFDSNAERGRAEFVGKAFEQILRNHAFGKKVDRTSSIEHEFRLPETFNAKNANAPILIKTEIQTEYRFPFREFADSLSRKTITTPAATPAPAPTPAPATPAPASDLEALRSHMKRYKPHHEAKPMIEAVLRGESFAPAGDRDKAMQRVVSIIAWMTPARKLTAEQLAEVLRPSLSVWAAEPDASKTLDEEIEKACEKFERAIAEREVKDAKRTETEQVILRSLTRSTREKTDDQEPPSVEDPIRFSVIKYAQFYWVHSTGATRSVVPGYYGPFAKESITVHIRTLCPQSRECHPDNEGPSLVYEKEMANGDVQIKDKTVDQIFKEYSTGATNVIGDLSLDSTWFDPEELVLHRAFPNRAKLLEPIFDQDIHDWLCLLGGEQKDQLLDWIAAVTLTDKTCAALYIESPPGTGKNLLADGLARFWRTTGPSHFVSIADQFNADMFDCPLILLDEGLPGKKADMTSAYIRTLVGSSEHTYSQKKEPRHKVRGCIRLFIAANNDAVLGQLSKEELSESDIQALADRFLHVKSDPAASDFLVQHKSELKSWLEDDRIINHALYLRENREIIPGKRFLVEGTPSEIHEACIQKGDKAGVVLEWLVRFMSEPSRIFKTMQQGPKRAFLGNGELLVNTQLVVDTLSEFRKIDEHMSLTAVGRVLGRLSDKRTMRAPRSAGRFEMHVIQTKRVFAFAKEMQIGNIDKMTENLNRVVEVEIDSE